MLKKTKQTMSIFKDMKQLFYKHLASSNNDKFGDTDIIVPIFYWGNHNVSWVQIYFSIKFGAFGAKVYFIYDDDFFKRYRFTLNSFLVRRLIKILCFYPSFNLLSPKVIDTDDDKFDELILK